MSAKVVWSQGMFLLPHHFQQEARHVEYAVDMRVRATGAHAWGFFDLALDQGLLAIGRIGITRASGILPDGTPFSIPTHDAQPMALDVPADMRGELACLAVPLAREGVTQIGFGDDEAHELRRWRAASEELRDHTNAADEPETVQTGALDLRIVRAKDAGDGYALLGLARVSERRSDNQVVLDPLYIAPQTRIDAT